MADMSNWLEGAVIDYFFRPGASAPTRPTTVKTHLYTAVTDAEAGTGTEVSSSGTAYAAQDSGFAAPTNGVTSNASDVTYPTATASWGTVTHAAQRDNSGNALTVIKALNSSKAVGNGDVFRFLAGDIDLTIS